MGKAGNINSKQKTPSTYTASGHKIKIISTQLPETANTSPLSLELQNVQAVLNPLFAKMQIPGSRYFPL